MMLADPVTVAALERRCSDLRACAMSLLVERRAQGVEQLSGPDEIRFRSMVADLKDAEFRLSEEHRKGSLPPNLARAAAQQAAQNEARSTTMSTATTYPSNVYRSGSTSYIRDLARVAVNADDTNESRRRLAEHAEEVGRGMEFRDLSRVDGSGGYAVPPAWLMNQYVTAPRPGRPFANLVQRQPLPGGTDSINIPKVLTPTATGVQVADNTTVTEVDLTDTFINAPVRTIAGQQSLALQLIDQSPIAFDDVVFADLAADHDQKLDLQVIGGTGLSGQVLGSLATPGIGSVPIPSLDIAGYFKALANAINTVNTTRFLPPDVIVMHPRRWGHLLSLLDLSNRPLFVPSESGAFNAAGVLTAVASENVVGRCCGLPIVIDSNLPTNLGAGTNEDVIVVMRSSDLVLWESGIRMRALPETKASTLTVLLQVYSYIAFSAARYPQSVVKITGLLPPSFT